MKKYILILFILASVPLFCQFSGGLGTAQSPYEITSKADMEALADSVNNGNYWSRNKHFKLMNDINDSVRTIIGFSYEKLNASLTFLTTTRLFFEGVFNGNNKKITLAISTTNGGTTGLFGVIGKNAIIRNVEVEGYLWAETNANIFTVVGGIAAANYGKIEYCINKCDISIYIDKDYIGDYAGGIAGHNFGYIDNCVNFGNVTVPVDDVGGIVGNTMSYYSNDLKYFAEISNCINFGAIYGNTEVGGIIGGCNGSNTYILNCVNLGNVYATEGPVGGIASSINWTIINNCINAGVVNGITNVGGIVGIAYRGEIKSSINVGVISPLICEIDIRSIGGIFGELMVKNSSDLVVSNCYYDKQLCIYGGIGNGGFGEDAAGRAEGRLTAEMLGNNLQAMLGNAEWIYNNNLYPILKYFANNKLLEIARAPVHFYAQGTDYETHNRLDNDFTINLENNVKWSNAFDIVTISGNQGIINKKGYDTLYVGKTDTFRLNADKFVVMNCRKTIPINIPSIYLITLYAVSEEGGTVEGGGEYYSDTLITIKATANNCYRFVNWTDSATGAVFSSEPIYNFCFKGNDLTLNANFIKDSFNLVVKSKPENAGIVGGSGRFPCGDSVIIEAQELGCYRFKNWTDNSGNVISEKATDTIIINNNLTLNANFTAITNHLIIRVGEHKEILPTLSNYEIPIYISSTANTFTNLTDTIKNLTLCINKNVFFPTYATNGLMTKNYNDDTIEISISNVLIPTLNSYEEKLLLSLSGMPILGDSNLSIIEIKDATFFSHCLTAEYIDGHISIKNCEEGGDRLLTDFDYSPTITITKNPVSEMLEVKCKLIEVGDYTLEIIDLTGHSNTIKNWFVNNTDAKDHIWNSYIYIQHRDIHNTNADSNKFYSAKVYY